MIVSFSRGWTPTTLIDKCLFSRFTKEGKDWVHNTQGHSQYRIIIEIETRRKKKHIVFLRFSTLLNNWLLHILVIYIYLLTFLIYIYIYICITLYLFICSYSCQHLFRHHHFYLAFSLLILSFFKEYKKWEIEEERERVTERKRANRIA